jgi:preprotein translocase subunit SecA
MLGFFSKMFGGSKSEKDVKKIEHLVTKINQHFSAFQSLSNDELRNKTQEFRTRIKDHLTQIDQEIVSKMKKQKHWILMICWAKMPSINR